MVKRVKFLAVVFLFLLGASLVAGCQTTNNESGETQNPIKSVDDWIKKNAW